MRFLYTPGPSWEERQMSSMVLKKTHKGLSATRYIAEATVQKMEAGNVEIISHGFLLEKFNGLGKLRICLYSPDGLVARLLVGSWKAWRMWESLCRCRDDMYRQVKRQQWEKDNGKTLEPSGY